MTKNVTFSIDEELLKNFKKACNEMSTNQSMWIARKMKEFIEEVKK